MIPVCAISRATPWGVWYQNDPQLVKELVELLWLKGDEPVTVEGKTLPLSEALQWHFELTVNTATIVENYAAPDAQRIAAAAGGRQSSVAAVCRRDADRRYGPFLSSAAGR
ncbi:hypothetical protein LNP74_05890 [Klebsiella pneumoniae subsp. pneumoniae]|nr:hypothetical protein [Klebsiella pneumoniae subsp. pneumoniae]